MLIIDMSRAIEKVMASMAYNKAEVDSLHEVKRPRKSRPASAADDKAEVDFSREVDVRFAVLLRFDWPVRLERDLIILAQRQAEDMDATGLQQ